MIEYVAGLLFDEVKSQVVLILKTHPEWQVDKFNAIGGRIENDETPLDAICREFREETDNPIVNWHEFAILHDERGWLVRFYWATGDVWACAAITDEEPGVFDVDDLPDNIIPNLRWLIPMALFMPEERCDSFVIIEQSAESEGK